MATIQKTQQSKLNKALENDRLKLGLAVLIAIAAAVITLSLFGIRYQTNDDATLSNIAAGAYGDTLHMVYVNVLFSLMLRPLYALVQTNWYVIVQVVLVVISLAAIIYTLMKKLGLVTGTVISLAVMVAFSQHIFYTFQYTECSFIMLSAGILLITDNLGDCNKSVLLGIVLALMGSMVRWTSFYAVGGLSAALLLYKFFTLNKEGKKRAVVTMVALFAVTFGAKAVDVAAYKTNPEWDKFTRYNSARTQYSDFKVLSLTEENPFEHLGVSDIDYVMLNNWDFYDKARFDTELLEELSAGGQDITAIQLVKNTVKQIIKMMTGKSYHYMFLAVALLSLLRLRPKWSVVPMIGMYGTFGVLMLYLIYEMRFPSWVEMGLIWTITAYALYCIGEISPNKIASAVVAVGVLYSIIAISMPAYVDLYNTYMDYETWTKEEQHYFEAMSRDKENIYLLSTTSINVAAGFDVMNPRTDGFYSNIVAYGGWLSRAPHRNRALAEYGLERPLVDAVDNPNVYLDYHNIDKSARYARQELGCDVYVVKTGENDFAPYQLVTQKPE